jgi:hypothetical protein
MTNRSKIDLRNEALIDLGVLAAGETASGNDAVVVDNAIQNLLEYLEDESILTFSAGAGSGDSVIPARMFHALIDMVGFRVGRKFGRQVGPELWADGIRTLRRSVLPGSDDAPVEATYF